MTPAAPPAATPPASGRVLTAVALAAALTPLNSTMIAVALPAMALGFDAAPASVTLLVITGYLLATLVFQMPAGSVADRLGYARALSLGRWIFGAGAVAAVAAPGLPVVVLGRLLMAAGGALMVPTAMALLRVAVPPERRARAFGTMGAVMAGAAAVGPAVGGLMLAPFGWRALFLVNLPLLAASALLQGPAPAAAASGTGTRQTFDWPGTLLLGGSLTLLVAASRVGGVAAVTCALGGGLLLVILVRQERRAPAPVVDLTLFHNRGFIAGSGVIALQNLAMYSLLALVPFLFGAGRDAAGRASISLAIVAMTAAMAVASPLGGWLTERVNLRGLVAAGSLAGAAGVLWLAMLPPSATPGELAVRLLVIGAAIGLTTGPAQAGSLSAVEASHAGMASAALSMFRYTGGIAGTVILGYAMGGAGREAVAMRIFIAAFVLAAGAAAMLGGHDGRRAAGRER
ncbi:MAG: MFS transporter [Vicinamibacterales bacterium]